MFTATLLGETFHIGITRGNIICSLVTGLNGVYSYCMKQFTVWLPEITACTAGLVGLMVLTATSLVEHFTAGLPELAVFTAG